MRPEPDKCDSCFSVACTHLKDEISRSTASAKGRKGFLLRISQTNVRPFTIKRLVYGSEIFQIYGRLIFAQFAEVDHGCSGYNT